MNSIVTTAASLSLQATRSTPEMASIKHINKSIRITPVTKTQVNRVASHLDSSNSPDRPPFRQIHPPLTEADKLPANRPPFITIHPSPPATPGPSRGLQVRILKPSNTSSTLTKSSHNLARSLQESERDQNDGHSGRLNPMVSSIGLEDVGQTVPLPPISGTENVTSLPRPSIPSQEASRALVRFVPGAESTPHARTNLTSAVQHIEEDALSGEFFNYYLAGCLQLLEILEFSLNLLYFLEILETTLNSMKKKML